MGVVCLNVKYVSFKYLVIYNKIFLHIVLENLPFPMVISVSLLVINTWMS